MTDLFYLAVQIKEAERAGFLLWTMGIRERSHTYTNNNRRKLKIIEASTEMSLYEKINRSWGFVYPRNKIPQQNK